MLSTPLSASDIAAGVLEAWGKENDDLMWATELFEGVDPDG